MTGIVEPEETAVANRQQRKKRTLLEPVTKQRLLVIN
jgi:hypothetical protein